uniref:Secretory carrier-associated membrane protein n=1 Tax=Macrostomum lignano TaxID=282301 RepID=A0A1I8JJB1_9PLAT
SDSSAAAATARLANRVSRWRLIGAGSSAGSSRMEQPRTGKIKAGGDSDGRNGGGCGSFWQRIQQARGGSGGSQPAQRPTDEFNPFDKSAKQQPPSQPAVLPSSQQQQQQPPPAYSASAQQRVTSEELERRQRELEAKARELERREEEQRRREQEMQADRNNNWPPLPSFCPVGPCFYQDFELEISQEFRWIVRLGYYLWMAHVAVLLINTLGTLAYFIEASSTDASTAGSRVWRVSAAVCHPAALLLYLLVSPAVQGVKNDSSFNFFLFFLVFFVQFVILVVQCLGFNYLGSCGWINGSSMLKSNLGAAGFMLFIAACFTCLAVLDMILLIRVHRIYRSTGASFAKAKQEFSQGVLSNETVRGVAADAATSSARSAFTGGGGRY